MKRKQNRFTGRRISGIMVRSGIVLAAIITVFQWMMVENIKHCWRRVDETLALNQQIAQLKSAMIEEETAQRGYDLTSSAVFLRPFYVAEQSYSQLAKELNAETVLSPSARQSLLQTIQEGMTWHDKYAVPQIQLLQQGKDVGNASLQAAQSAMENFQAHIDLLQSNLSAQSTDAENRVLKHAETVFDIFVMLVVLLGLYAFISTRRQLRETRLAESMLRRTQENLAYAQRIARIGSWEWDVENNEFVMSDELYHILNIDPTIFEISQHGLLGLIHPDDRGLVVRTMDSALRGSNADAEYRLLRPDGEERVLHMHIESVYEHGSATQLLGTVQDITERKKTEDLLLKSEKLSAVGELAAGVAHEIRNPLTTLKGFIQLLPTLQGEAAERYLHIMRDEVDRMEMIVGELLVLAKPQAIHFTAEDIPSKLEDVITLLNTRAILNNVRIVTDIADHVPKIQCEPNQLKQVFVNVIQNALDAMPNGGVLTVRMYQEFEDIKIEFIDNGNGIEPQRLAKLGEPFYTTKEKGTGLGLMVTQKIIQNHHGTFAIDSQLGEGTTVTLTLPITE